MEAPRDSAIIFATPARSVKNSKPLVTMSHKRSWSKMDKMLQLDSTKANVCRRINFSSECGSPPKIKNPDKPNSSLMIPRAVLLRNRKQFSGLKETTTADKVSPSNDSLTPNTTKRGLETLEASD